MENFRFIKIGIWILGGALLVIPLFGFAYDDETTHPALTQEIIKLFNQEFKSLKISDGDAEYIIQGSVDEDMGARWMYHFFDPVYDRGLVLGRGWMSSKEWAQNTKAQAGFVESAFAGTLKSLFSGKDDYSWDRAIYEYVWGDKKRALKALGHILHLIEDATVPDHTRNDSHPPYLDTSPYEKWTEKFTGENYSASKNEEPILLPATNNYFDKLASYSNNNFFSKDTIFDRAYNKPVAVYYVGEFGYSDLSYPLVRRVKQLGGGVEYTLTDEQNKILTSYWSLLSKQAVLHGAGVIKLFFDEVGKEKQTKTLYEKNRSWLGKRIDKFQKGVLGLASVLYGSSVTERDLEDPIEVSPPAGGETSATTGETSTETTKASPPEGGEALKTSEVEPLPQAQPEVRPRTADTIEVSPPTGGETSTPSGEETSTKTAEVSPPAGGETSAPKTAPRSSDTSSIVPIAGGGGSPQPEPTPAPTSLQQDTIPPDPPVITSPQDNQVFATTTITFSGTAEAGSAISNNFNSASTTTSTTGNWLLVMAAISQGTTTVQFFATDGAGNKSNGSSRIIFVDSLEPSVSLTVNECHQSLSPTDCLIATTTVTLEWSSGASDLDYYELTVNGSVSTTTSTSSAATLADNSSNTFSVRAKDATGNWSTSQTKTVEVVTRPIVINEIAWMGTSAGRWEDEWLELYNTADKSISLSGLTLRSATDDSPYIQLSGTIAAGGFFLLERTSSTTIADTVENQIYTGALVNGGEVLELSRASTTIDKTPEISVCSGWCAGAGNPQYWSMERYDASASGENSSNWGHFQSFLGNGKNADNLAINGTPGKRNSLNYLIDKSGSALGQDKTITKTNSPYIIPSSFTIPAGKTLTVKPGVTVKFYNTSSSLTVNGILKTEGTALEPVVFTSFKDDGYGGDTNQDGATSSPAAGDWVLINILNSGSVLDQTIIRYGGFNSPGADLKVENSSVTIKNSVIEKSKGFGLWLQNASGSVGTSTVRNNNSAGILADGGSPDILNNVFAQNAKGLLTQSGAAPNVSGNSFTQNTSEAAVISSGSYPIFSGNSAGSNGLNGISIQGVMNQNYTLSNDLPYVSAGYTVSSGKTLTIPAGAVLKFTPEGYLSVSGTLTAVGSQNSKIVFTSLKDDAYGGDTNGDATTTAPQAGDWVYLNFSGSGASSSTMEHTIVRYGKNGALKVDNASIDIKNSTVESNYSRGIWLNNSALTKIVDSLVQNHQQPDPGSSHGLFLTSSSTPFIQNTTFRNNKVGIEADGTSSVQSGGWITFDGNTTNTVPASLIP